VVVSVIAMGRRVHQNLVDQESSANVMFWDAFVGLNIPLDQLRLFDGVLVGFTGEPVEVRDFVDLRTFFYRQRVNEYYNGTLHSGVNFILIQSPPRSSFSQPFRSHSLNNLSQSKIPLRRRENSDTEG